MADRSLGFCRLTGRCMGFVFVWKAKHIKDWIAMKTEEHEDMHNVRTSLVALEERLQKLSAQMERTQIADYVQLLNRPFSLMWRNILGGLSRGIGIAIGFTIFASTILYVLQLLGALNLPIIGDYIADIVRIVQHQLEGKTY